MSYWLRPLLLLSFLQFQTEDQLHFLNLEPNNKGFNEIKTIRR